MGLSMVMGSHCRTALVGLGLVLGLVDCSSSNDKAAAPEVDCQAGDQSPCKSYTDPVGNMLEMGPYGAQMDANVGKGFENALQMGDTPNDASYCQGFASIFMEDPKLTARLLDTTQNGLVLDFSLYTVYRPVHWPSGKLPVITWGNGTCAQPEGYGALLRYIASYGYFVVAANSREVGAVTGAQAPMLRALDYAAAANADPSSPYYQKLDLTKVGAMGHSQGGQATADAANDPRVLYAIAFNAVDKVAKPYLAISGDVDITGFTAASMAADVNGSSVPGAWLYYHNPAGMGPIKGHLVLMLTPQRVTAPALAWWQMTLSGDATAHAMFVGDGCGLCTMSSMTDFEYGQHGLP
jgi:hypothetical protein